MPFHMQSYLKQPVCWTERRHTMGTLLECLPSFGQQGNAAEGQSSPDSTCISQPKHYSWASLTLGPILRAAIAML